jgi:hypothetical protein
MPKKPAAAPKKKNLSTLPPKTSGPMGGMGVTRLVVTKGTISAKF